MNVDIFAFVENAYNNRQLLIFFTCIFIAWFAGLFIDIMNVDAAQYASMCREMVESGSWLQVYDLGNEYLDKPPLTFWLGALSFKVFGISNWAYKLPSFLFAWLAILGTYGFTRVYYDKRTSQIAALVLASCQAIFLITNDCRTDTLLMGSVSLAVWQLAEGFEKGRLQNFLLGFFAIGLAMLAKGPIGLIIPAFGFAGHFVLKKQYHNFLRWQYLPGILIIGAMLLPMCIGLYHQFDLHPEKIVNGQTGVSGLKFYFWTQSFGRITGENAWKNDVYFLFLFQSMLWAFFPWILLFIASLLSRLQGQFNKGFRFNQVEYISISGFILTYCALALSKYQLPHYIFSAFPYASVLVASFIVKLKPSDRLLIGLAKIQYVLIFLLVAILLIASFYFFPTHNPVVTIYIVAVLLTVAAIWFRYFKLDWIAFCVLFMTAGNIIANTHLYPELLKYQSGSVTGKILLAETFKNNRVYYYRYQATHALHFYSQQIVPELKDFSNLKQGDVIVTGPDGPDYLKHKNVSFQTLKKGNHYSVQLLSLPFLMPHTREQKIEPYFIVKVLLPNN